MPVHAFIGVEDEHSPRRAGLGVFLHFVVDEERLRDKALVEQAKRAALRDSRPGREDKGSLGDYPDEGKV